MSDAKWKLTVKQVFWRTPLTYRCLKLIKCIYICVLHMKVFTTWYFVSWKYSFFWKTVILTFFYMRKIMIFNVFYRLKIFGKSIFFIWWEIMKYWIFSKLCSVWPKHCLNWLIDLKLRRCLCHWLNLVRCKFDNNWSTIVLVV